MILKLYTSRPLRSILDLAPVELSFSSRRLANDTPFPHSHSKSVRVESHTSSGPPRTNLSPHSSHISTTRRASAERDPAELSLELLMLAPFS